MKRDKNIFTATSHLSTGRLLNYLRRELSPGEAHEVERHLADCDFCSDALEGLKKLDDTSSMLSISATLHKMARKRKVVKQRLFSQPDLISLIAVFFLILFLVFVALVIFWKR
jgi:anti-sigma factor RsiW